MTTRLVAICHGDPADPTKCGRPLVCRIVPDKFIKDRPLLRYVCMVHGDVEKSADIKEFFYEDARRRVVWE